MNFDLRYFLLPLNSPSPQCREVIKRDWGTGVHSCAMTTLQVPLLISPLSEMQKKTPSSGNFSLVVFFCVLLEGPSERGTTCSLSSYTLGLKN